MYDIRQIGRGFVLCQLCILSVYWLHLSRQRNRTIVSMEENLLNDINDVTDLKDQKNKPDSHTETKRPHVLPENCVHNLRFNKALPTCQVSEERCLNDSEKYHIDTRIPTYDGLVHKYSNTLSNGSWTPCDCHSESKLAIIVPYNNTDLQLRIWLNNIVPFLIYQRRAFTIFVIEQNTDVLYNRGALMNIGITEALRFDNEYDCFIFHDDSFLPENLCNVYSCSQQYARHLAVAVDKHGYTLQHELKLDGALAIHRTTLQKTNGFTNYFYAIGCENYNMYARLLCENYTVERDIRNVSRYTSLTNNAMEKHLRHSDKIHYQCMHTWRYKKYDGLSSVNYTMAAQNDSSSTPASTSIIHVHNSGLYLQVNVRIHGPSASSEVERTYLHNMQRFSNVLHNDTEEFERVRGILNEKDVVNTFMLSLRHQPHESSLGIFKSFLGFVLGV